MINLAELPEKFLKITGPVAQIIYPKQGMTSETAILLGAKGRYLVKHSRPPQYHDWLRYEAMVLEALKGAHLPVPELFAFHEGDSAWMLTSVLPGEPMSAVFMKTQDSNFRQKLLHNLGKILAQIHRSPPPATMNLKAVDWLDAMLEKAEKNLRLFDVDGDEDLLRSIKSRRPEGRIPVLIHGDFTLDNVLVLGGKITGVIDWDGGALGHPGYDLALITEPCPEAFRDAADLDAFYIGYGGKRLSAPDQAFFLDLYEFF